MHVGSRPIASGRMAATAAGTRTTVCLPDLEARERDSQAVGSDERVRTNLWPRHAARARIRTCCPFLWNAVYCFTTVNCDTYMQRGYRLPLSEACQCRKSAAESWSIRPAHSGRTVG
jgi:hypothetical protein